MPPLPDALLTDAQREAITDFKRTRHTDVLEGPFGPLVRSPELMRHVQRVGEYLRYRSALPRRISEMAILLAARHWCQQFEWRIHATDAAKAGLSRDVIDAISEGRRPSEMADDEEVLYDFCVELFRNQSVSDLTYARAVRMVQEQGVIDAVGILGYYSLLAMVMNTARTATDAEWEPELKKFPN